MAAFSSTAFSTSAFSVNAFDFGSTPPQPAPDQPSNWQAHYWVHSKRRTKADEDDERRRLGILPPELAEDAQKAVRDAVQAAVEIRHGADEGIALRAAARARKAFEDAYRQAFKDAYIEEMVAAQWEVQITRERRRRAVALLLLH